LVGEGRVTQKKVEKIIKNARRGGRGGGDRELQLVGLDESAHHPADGKKGAMPGKKKWRKGGRQEEKGQNDL